MAVYTMIAMFLLQDLRDTQAKIVTSRFWRPGAPDFVYPEVDKSRNQLSSEYLANKEDFGVAFAGGGLRGAGLAHGITRSLRQAGILQKARYMTVSSGSVWFGVALHFQTQDSIDTFLGESLPPEELSPDEMVGTRAGSYVTRLRWPIRKFPKKMPRDEQLRRLNATLTASNAWHQRQFELQHSLEEGVIGKLLHCFENLCSCVVNNVIPDGSLHELWTLLTSYVVLHPFGLASPNSEYCHASAIDAVQRKLGASGKLYASQDLNENLPFLLSQSAAMSLHSGSNQSSDPLLAYPLDNTPLYTGVPIAYTGANISSGESFKSLGDMLLEPFGFDSEPVESMPQVSTGEVKVRPRHNLLNTGSLAKWTGIATCYAAAFQIRPWASKIPQCAVSAVAKLMPQASLWSPLEVDQRGVPAANKLMVGDAGVFDDMGHLPLLRRKVKKILIYDSSAVHDNNTGVEAENIYEMVYLLAAFGQPGGLVPPYPPGSPNPFSPKDFLTVFEPKEFAKFWSKVKELHAAKKPVVIHDTFTVVDNPWFGIVGGWKVEIVWVLAMPIDAWRSALPAASQAGLPSWFPNMLASEATSQFELSALSQYGSWLTEHAVLDEVRKMLSNSSAPEEANRDHVYV